ncbi:MAG: hypothetical protein GC192_07485 [Bacteroidetes bacterium]|nr:hypothetical protein [Bacteroidota bacterium]
MKEYRAIFKNKFIKNISIISSPKSTIFALMFILPNINFAQKQKYYEIYSWGLYFPTPTPYNFKCKESIDMKYGFKVIWKAGCVVKKRDVRKWELHNRFVNWKIKRLNGKDWKQTYSEEIKQCKIEDE